MDQQVGTADKQSEGLQVLGVGEPLQVYLEGMDICYTLEPLVIQGLRQSVNLEIPFLQEHELKMTCKEEEVANMPLQDRTASRVRLVDGECHKFLSH